MVKGIIYYTDNRIEDPINSMVQKYILESELPIVSTSLKPINFGRNIVVEGERGYPTMIKQIVTALEWSGSDYVFFCEHDVLYHKSHFDFTPPRDDMFYYNTNDWRWDYPNDRVIRYNGLSSLSQMCCNRKLALNHFRKRLEKIQEHPELFSSREPDTARKWGYEPGTKKRRKGGFSDEESGRWSSDCPNVDIRHHGTFSPNKTTLEGFKHQPTGWEETTLDKIEGWDLKGLFNL